MAKVTVELVDVHCKDTEDLTGADEFYVMGAVLPDGQADPTPVLTTPININDNQTMGFPADQSVIFNGEVPDGGSVALYLRAYDEDVAKDWGKRPEWLDGIAKSIGVAAGTVAAGAVTTGVGTAAAATGGAATAAALGSNPVGWGILATALGAALSVGASTL